MTCIHNGHGLATHELWFDRDRTAPVCGACADHYPPERVTPITHHECYVCEREIERTWPDLPVCEVCERAGWAVGEEAV
jgi:hypothetical protein